MCTTYETKSGPHPAGWFRAWFGKDPKPAWPPEPTGYRPDPDDNKAVMNWLHGQALAQGRELCRECQAILGDVPGESRGLLNPRLCYGCDVWWFEENVLAPLVDRLGRRGTRKALRHLVRNIEALI